MTWILAAVVLWLAYSNGANDNIKGVATLFGAGTASYKRTLAWATLCTFLGSMAALWAGAGLVRAFSGKGLVPDVVLANPRFLASVGIAAAATVLLATRLGFPISTTHALMGALVGAGLAAPEGKVHLGALGNTFVLPLLLSPLIALALSALLYMGFRWARARLGVVEESCLCIGREVRVIAQGPLSSARAAEAVAEARLSVAVDTEIRCVQRYRGAVVGVDAQTALDASHYLSAGTLCFARGLNDTPKILALLAVAPLLPLPLLLSLVALVMALGGILQARRVADTMAHRIADMNDGQGFTANLVSSALVLFASRLGLPVSTTHVTCGALFGIGAVNRSAQWQTISRIALAWVVTLPLAATQAALAMGALS